MSEETVSQQGTSSENPVKPDKTWVDKVFFSPDERRLRAGWRLLVQFALLAVFVVGVQFIIRYFLYPEFPVLANYTYFLSQGTILLGVIGSVFVARRILDNRSFRSLGLVLGGKGGRDFGMGLLISLVMTGFVYLLQWALGWLQFDSFVWSVQITPSFILFWFIFLALFFLVAWQEELLFRGYWLTNLNEGLNAYWAVGLTAVGYAALHLLNPNYSPQSLVLMMVMGAYLGFAMISSGSLWFPIGLHFGWKLFQGNIFGFRVGGLRAPGLIVHQMGGPELWTGGQTGPETGLVILPAILLSAFFVYLYTSIED